MDILLKKIIKLSKIVFFYENKYLFIKNKHLSEKRCLLIKELKYID